MAHSLGTLVEAATMLKDQSDIAFILVGSGAETEKLKALTSNRNLSNVHFIPRQSKQEINRYWHISDMTIISLRDTKLFATVIPSKIFEAMAAGVPIVASIPKGEASNIIESSGAGILTKAESAAGMAEAILTIVGSPQMRKKISIKAQDAALLYGREAAAAKMMQAVEEL